MKTIVLASDHNGVELKKVLYEHLKHNDSNVICLGSWITTEKESLQIVNSWLSTPFGEGRHVKRVEKISEQKPNKIVFTNGCFDILHTGHIGLLKFAKTFGDRLIVAINSDDSIKKLKGSGRPINSQNDRKAIIQAIDCVDEVIIFDDVNPKNIRDSINPDVIVRGGEFTANEIKERDGIDDNVIIKIFPIVTDKSTTNVIEKIKQND